MHPINNKHTPANIILPERQPPATSDATSSSPTTPVGAASSPSPTTASYRHRSGWVTLGHSAASPSSQRGTGQPAGAQNQTGWSQGVVSQSSSPSSSSSAHGSRPYGSSTTGSSSRRPSDERARPQSGRSLAPREASRSPTLSPPSQRKRLEQFSKAGPYFRGGNTSPSWSHNLPSQREASQSTVQSRSPYTARPYGSSEAGPASQGIGRQQSHRRTTSSQQATERYPSSSPSNQEARPYGSSEAWPASQAGSLERGRSRSRAPSPNQRAAPSSTSASPSPRRTGSYGSSEDGLSSQRANNSHSRSSSRAPSSERSKAPPIKTKKKGVQNYGVVSEEERLKQIQLEVRMPVAELRGRRGAGALGNPSGASVILDAGAEAISPTPKHSNTGQKETGLSAAARAALRKPAEPTAPNHPTVDRDLMPPPPLPKGKEPKAPPYLQIRPKLRGPPGAERSPTKTPPVSPGLTVPRLGLALPPHQSARHSDRPPRAQVIPDRPSPGLVPARHRLPLPDCSRAFWGPDAEELTPCDAFGSIRPEYKQARLWDITRARGAADAPRGDRVTCDSWPPGKWTTRHIQQVCADIQSMPPPAREGFGDLHKQLRELWYFHIRVALRHPRHYAGQKIEDTLWDILREFVLGMDRELLEAWQPFGREKEKWNVDSLKVFFEDWSCFIQHHGMFAGQEVVLMDAPQAPRWTEQTRLRFSTKPFRGYRQRREGGLTLEKEQMGKGASSAGSDSGSNERVGRRA